MRRTIYIALVMTAELLGSDAVISSKTVNTKRAEQVVGPRSSGPAVVRAQVMLHRLHFSCGEIDGRYGANLQRAISAFQESRGRRATGVIDPGMWELLDADTTMPLTQYLVSSQDIAGPF